MLEIDELLADPHLRARGTVFQRDGRLEAAPAPRLSESTSTPGTRPDVVGQHTAEVLLEAGFGADEIDALNESHTIVVGGPVVTPGVRLR